MTTAMYVVVAFGLAASAVAFAFAVAKGRVVPTHTVPWVFALVILGIDTALHIAASVAMVLAGESGGAWLIGGTLGFLALCGVAVLRARWAAVILLASAVLVPLLVGLGGLVARSDPQETVPWFVAVLTYSVPAAITGGLLALSARPRPEGSARR